MTLIDAAVLWVVHVGGALAAALALVLLVAWALLKVTWGIYQKAFEWEHLVRTVRHCYRRTWIKPPEKAFMPRKRGDDGEWEYEGDEW